MVGDIEVLVPYENRSIVLRQDSDMIVVKILDAAHLAVLLDEAIAMARRERGRSLMRDRLDAVGARRDCSQDD